MDLTEPVAQVETPAGDTVLLPQLLSTSSFSVDEILII
jgi:hypothetical protein